MPGTLRSQVFVNRSLSGEPAGRIRQLRNVAYPCFSSLEIFPAIRAWIPTDEGGLDFDLFDQRPNSGKPVEIASAYCFILVPDGD